MFIGYKILILLFLFYMWVGFGSCAKGGASWKDCKLRSERITLPSRRRLLTVQEFRDNLNTDGSSLVEPGSTKQGYPSVIDNRTLYGFYGGIATVAAGLTLKNTEWRYFFNNNETSLDFTTKGNALDGSCVYETNRTYFCSDTFPYDGAERMLLNNNDYVIAFFSSNPEKYVWVYICICAGANGPLTTGVCPTSNTIIVLHTPMNGPDNINLERAARDLRELTCLNMEGLPGIYGFTFVQGENECPDRPERIW